MALLDEYQVGVDGPWSAAEVAHLWRRAGFGALPDEQTQRVGAGDQNAFRDAVETLIAYTALDPHLDLPAGTGTGVYGDPLADLPDDTTDLGNIKAGDSKRNLGGQWLYRMRYTSQPLQEQFALFLHDHFVSEFGKIVGTIPLGVELGNDGSGAGQACSSGTLEPDARGRAKRTCSLLANQLALFRGIGIGDFRNTLIAITRDPAMLLYLDNHRNIKGRAQENFAREVMELFSMGVGNYSEQDVQQIAKCLTGERLPQLNTCSADYSSAYQFEPNRHETGDKTVFAQTITFDNTGDETIQVIDHILTKTSVNPLVSTLDPPYNTLPATAVYMAWKLLRWFVSHDIVLLPVPDDAVLELADYLRGDDASDAGRRFPYDIRAALRKVFLSKLFYDDANRFTMYKTPADFVVSALHMLGIAENFTNGAGPVARMVGMGMELFEPPNVAGCDHGESWINSGSLISRYNYGYRVAETVLSGANGDAYANSLLQSNGGPLTDVDDLEGLVEFFRERLLQQTLSQEEHDLLIAFITGVTGNNTQQQFTRRVRGIIHVMMCMPAFQLK